MHAIQLPDDYAIVLQQIDEDGEEDFNDLAESLSFERSRLAHIVQSLHHKGLIAFDGNGERGFWIRLSHKGRQLSAYLWPDRRSRPSFT